MKMAKDLILN